MSKKCFWVGTNFAPQAYVWDYVIFQIWKILWCKENGAAVPPYIHWVQAQGFVRQVLDVLLYCIYSQFHNMWNPHHSINKHLTSNTGSALLISQQWPHRFLLTKYLRTWKISPKIPIWTVLLLLTVQAQCSGTVPQLVSSLLSNYLEIQEFLSTVEGSDNTHRWYKGTSGGTKENEWCCSNH